MKSSVVLFSGRSVDGVDGVDGVELLCSGRIVGTNPTGKIFSTASTRTCTLEGTGRADDPLGHTDRCAIRQV